jgi:general secretion pathway protein K
VPRRRQCGAAIVTALLVVVLATTVVSGLYWRLNVTVRSVENRLALAQTHWVERAVLDWARVVLRLDMLRGGPVDHLEELWAPPIERTVLDETVTGGGQIGDAGRKATLAGQMFDAQARMNLNNLIDDPNGKYLAAFERLLEIVGQPRSLATVLQKRLQRSVPRSGERGMIPATALPLLRTEDLRLLPEFDDTVVGAIAPFVAFLPQRPTLINVNTAEPQVIAAAVEGLDVEVARRFVAQNRRRFTSVDAAMTAMNARATLPKDLLSVNSSFFLVVGMVRYDRVTAQTETLIQRQSNKIEIVWQQRF